MLQNARTVLLRQRVPRGSSSRKPTSETMGEKPLESPAINRSMGWAFVHNNELVECNDLQGETSLLCHVQFMWCS